jgi:hypothetical protein
MYLSIYDISGIQKYIFDTEKLKEQVGASSIVHWILYEKLPEVVREEKIKEGKYADKYIWETDLDELTEPTESHRGTVVSVGGGIATVLYKDKVYMDECNREIQKAVLEVTRGRLRLCHACVEIEFSDNLNEKYNELIRKLAREKSNPNALYLADGLSIVEEDSNHEPITVLVEDNETIYGSVSRIEKRKKFKKIKDVRDELGYVYATQFEDFREKDRKSFTAVIHIDGNGMAHEKQRMMSKLTGSIQEGLIELRKISNEIADLYNEVLRRTILQTFLQTFEDKEEGKIAFRKMVSDGDDVTVIIESSKAFDFVENFMENLKNLRDKENKGEEKRYMLLDKYGFNTTASAGIAFVHDKYPIYDAYGISENLCSITKESAKECREDEAVSGFDFHIVDSGLKSDIKIFREKNYNKANVILNIRPYFFDDEKTINSYSEFKSLKNSIKNKVIPRSKLKCLRKAYTQGKEAADNYYKLMAIRYKEDITEFDSPFIPDYDGNNYIARFFDAIDIMDM